MAKVIIGGQTLCLLLSLLVTPVAYALFDDIGRLTWVRRLGRAAPRPLRPHAWRSATVADEARVGELP